MGFKGLVISDSLVMKGLMNQYASIEDASVAAINAGCDVLILGGLLLNGEDKGFELTTRDVLRIHKRIVDGVKNGEINTDQIDSSVMRILQTKKRYLQK